MANQISLNVYKFNSQNPIPLSKVSKVGFPSANVLLRVATDQNGNPGTLLTNGFRPYGIVQTADGNQFYVQETQATLVQLANS